MQCPNCRSFDTKSGKDKLKSEFFPLILIAFGTAGLGIVLGIPYMLAEAREKHYRFYKYWCNNCKYMWGKSNLAQLAEPARSVALTQEKNKLQRPRRLALTTLILAAV